MEQLNKLVLAADLIKQSLPQAHTPNYDHIKLTPEEEKLWSEWGILKGKKKKAAKIAELEYAERLNSKKVFKKMSFDELRTYVLAANPSFVVDDDNVEIFETLCLYFSGDPAFELQGDYSFKKGINVTGPIGCGKTYMMELFCSNPFRPFAVTSCRVIADSYQMNGTEALYKYSRLLVSAPSQNFGHGQIGHCYDDLGTEEDKKNFGNQVNVMQDIIYKVYDNKMEGMIHITTNLGGDEIEDLYGDRVRSRVRQLFNQVAYSPSAKDRRV